MPLLNSLTVQLMAQRPLPPGDRNRPEAIAKWVDAVAPCLVPGIAQSVEETDLIITYLQRRGVREQDIGQALAMSSYKFDVSLHHQQVSFYMSLPKVPNQPDNSMSPAHWDPEKLKFEAARLDVLFQTAERAQNVTDMKRIAELLIALLSNADDMIQDRERLRQIRSEILMNARNIAPNIRPYGPKDPPVPGPDGRVPKFVFQVMPQRLRGNRNRR